MNPLYFHNIVNEALKEDLGFQDLTTEAIISENHCSVAEITAKEAGIIAGMDVANYAFKLLDDTVSFQAKIVDGEKVSSGQVVAVIEGRTRTLLGGERVALNFMQRLSGIATGTKKAVESIKDFPCRLVDTRKTTPGLRGLEKYAVRMGGGYNHRFGLFDAILIKDNHIAAAGGITEAVSLVREKIGHMVKVEVETETLAQVEEALSVPIDIIMLDNMSLNQMREAVRLINKKVLAEASGGINLENVVQVAETGVDLVSLGWLTHSVRALDLSLNLIESSILDQLKLNI
ncbi:nicotinate-nucleotide pyrophosphorylase (carboxylating) [Desulfosporosinus acidiphilus SJ4]|uniref:Probable nicotinate-nucleotide pyrophosphorylase [carboxylating] n=1 Tax=Desulfosporosinus acidiphilus (strain DSM 22704 / JCM 16185 / SJ4) TaxID=646529 RepID=I4D4Y6_DESAJ|nr:carboxylating nicotinate-nucleotide diphosphorylase [Desulfosporosinus acidiphilus]AFM40860.1 nicotinate-nucleotide pyrophosphorylase (carboxylating) [Desulfosporosinus acidiphilus SJ4]